MMELIGIFGGTFNPIHNGHLALAQSVLETLHCTQIRFVPAALPPHKAAPAVTAQHRAAMVHLAIQGHPQFVLDTCELDRQGPSYTIETLHLLRQRFPHQSLCLLMGQDSYQKLPTWHRWTALLDYAHLLVIHRAEAEKTLSLHAGHRSKLINIEEAPTAFSTQAHGLISYLTQTPPAISSTGLRASLAQHALSTIADMPAAVLQYIQQHHLYQRPARE